MIALHSKDLALQYQVSSHLLVKRPLMENVVQNKFEVPNYSMLIITAAIS
jgi:hypothetical protein